MKRTFHIHQSNCRNLLLCFSILATAMRAAVVTSATPHQFPSPSSSDVALLQSSHFPQVTHAPRSSPMLSPSISLSTTKQSSKMTPSTRLTSENDSGLFSHTLSGTSNVDVHNSLKRLRKLLIDDYTQWHNQSRRSRKVRMLVYQQRTAQPGLGDRFTALLAGYVHAVASQRLFLVDWIEPIALRDALAPRKVNVFWDESDDKILNKTSTCLCDGGYCTKDAMNSKAHTLYYNVAHPYHIVDVLNVLRTYGGEKVKKDISGVKEETLQGDSTLFGAIFNTLFVPSKTLSKIMEERAGPMLRGDFVSIHARLGSGVLEKGPRFSNIDHDCVARLLLRAVRKWQGRTRAKGVFLATDTPSFRGLFRNLAKKENVGHVMCGEWDTKHVANMNVDDKDDREIYFLSLMELVLIGRGRAIIGMGSRFADVGGFFGGKDANIEVGLNGECSIAIVSAHQHIWQARRDNLSANSATSTRHK